MGEISPNSAYRKFENEMIKDLSESLRLTKKEKNERVEIRNRLYSLLKDEWPQCVLCEYGSCVNGLALSESDVDISIFLSGFSYFWDGDTLIWAVNPPKDQISDGKIVNNISKILTRAKIRNQAIPSANVPIVKFNDQGISVDVSVGNLEGLLNSWYLYDLQSLDPRVSELILIVKKWAKCRNLNSSFHGTLSSHSYGLMCCNFLQLRKPPILPIIQMDCMPKNIALHEHNRVRGYFSDMNRFSCLPERNKETISELLLAFFTYWGYEYDYEQDIISVRTGQILSRREKQWSTSMGIAIEDPFNEDRNISSAVRSDTCQLLLASFREAVEIMRGDAPWLSLCEEM